MSLPSESRQRITGRLLLLQGAIVAVFLSLAVGFWYFQVVEHARFAEMAEHNHQRTLALRAPRGVLLDRHGRVLVENRESFTIAIVREHTTDLARTVRLLAAAVGVDEARVQAIVDRHRGEPSYRPIVILEDATLAQVAAVTARRLDFELPDVLVQRVPTRRYPAEAMAAHLFGYVGEANEAQMAAEKVSLGAIVGQSGIERTYNHVLMGEDGARLVVVNSVGREIRTIEEVPPVEGRRIQLTVDADMQRAAEEAFRVLGYNGAAVVLDPRNGEVLTLTSLPSYDSNDFASGGVSRATWAALSTDALRPLQNRALQGRYSPGSTFKLVVAAAALQEVVITPEHTVMCRGGARLFGNFFQCWKRGGHGPMDLRHAIEQSCNTYFYNVGNMVGIDAIHRWAAALGLAQKSGIDLPNEVESLVPSTKWKQETTGEKWYPGETISVSIGQGQVSVTPVSMAVMTAAIANGGTRVTPHLVKAIDHGSGWEPVDAPPPRTERALAPEAVQAIHDGLWMVVNQRGTGRNARIEGRDVAGKTGTAQVISLDAARALAGRTDRDLRDHGWFVFFAPRDNPEIAGAVFAEHGEHGSTAALIARHVLETYYARAEGRPLPVFAPPGTPPVPAPPEEPRLVAITAPGPEAR
ncbi:MAG: penicillin-binding protein 2 [Acidimicrobiia bacterium]|nr:penicillin-binding protein 2 [Acidimicrobiia bacterium]